MNEIVQDKVRGISGKLADFAVSFSLADVPPRAIENAKSAILDCFGVSVLAATHEIGTAVLAFARDNAAAGPCTVWGTKVTANARDAALFNGTLAHGLDFDDRNHSSTYSLAAPVAVAEQNALSGAKVLEAFIISREVRNCLDPLFAKRGDGVGPGAQGWHSNGILGPIATACGAGRILGMDRQTILSAIGLAGGSCGALTRDGGTMAKPFRCGQAAATGLSAALLARSGFSGDHTVLEGPFGLLQALGSVTPEILESLGKDLGKKFHLESDLRGKSYASCTASQDGLEAMLRLVGKTAVDPMQVDSIDCNLKPFPLVREKPTRGYEGRFSMPFCLAIALTRHDLGPDDFTDKRLKEPAIQELIRRTRHTPDSQSLVVTLKDGRKLVEPLKHPANITEWNQFEAKFRRCVAGILTDRNADLAVESVRNLEKVGSIKTLTAALKPA